MRGSARPTRRSSRSRRAASAAPTSTSTTAGSRWSRASSSATSTSARSSTSATTSRRVAPGDRVCGCYGSACGECFFCARGDFHKCDHGPRLRPRQDAGRPSGRPVGAARCPQRRPHPAQGPGGDVATTSRCSPATSWAPATTRSSSAGSSRARSPRSSASARLGSARSRQRSPRAPRSVIAIDTVAERLELAGKLGATPVHLTDGDPRGTVKELTERPRRRRDDRRRRPPRRARSRHPAHPQGRHRVRHRRLRRAQRGPHGARLDQGADAEVRPRERDQARRPGAREARRPARSTRRRW